jgi:hypothetical protein
MDEVLVAALALSDPTSFFREGDHQVDDILEVPPPPQTVTDLPTTPAGVN